MNTVICRLCSSILDNSNKSEMLGEMVKEMLDIVLLKLNITDDENPTICKTCTEKLHKAFQFKSACINTTVCLYSYLNSLDNKAVDLTEVYRRERTINNTFVFGKNDEVCRFCLSLTKRNVSTTLKSEILNYKTFFGKFLPELDLEATDKEVVCEYCHESLEKYVEIVKLCLNTESQTMKKCQTLSCPLGKWHKQFKKEQTFAKTSPNLDSFPLKNEKGIDLDKNLSTLMEKTKNETSHPTERWNNEIKIEPDIYIEENPSQHTEATTNGMLLSHRLESWDNKIKEQETFVSFSPNFDSVLLKKEQDINENPSKDMEKITNEIVIKDDTLPIFKLEQHEDSIKIEENEIKSESATLEDEIKRAENMYRILSEEMGNIYLAQEETRSSNELVEDFTIIHEYSDRQKIFVDNDFPLLTFKCEICTYETKQKGNLKSHMLMHKDVSEINMFKCPICTYESKRKCGLKNHMLSHRDVSDIQMFKCPICACETKHRHSLLRHMLNHKNTSEIKMYKCKICAYEAKHRYRLKAHMLSHKDITEINMFKCAICTYEAKRKWALRQHMLTHQPESEIKMYKCEICAFKTKLKRTLNTHVLIHQDVSEIKMFKCGYCAFEAESKAILKNHICEMVKMLK